MTYEQERDAAERRDRLRAKGEEVLSEGRAAASQAADSAVAAVEDQKSTFAGQIDDISKAAKTAADDLRNRDRSKQSRRKANPPRTSIARLVTGRANPARTTTVGLKAMTSGGIAPLASNRN